MPQLRFGKGFRVRVGNKRAQAAGRTLVKTVNLYVPPAYRSDGEELPRGGK